MNTILISTIPDNNIYHIFAFDIIKQYNPFINIIYINDQYIDKSNPCQLWRIFVMKKLYPNINIQYNNNFKSSCITHQGFNHKDFIKYPIDKHISNIVNIINSKYKGEYILVNQRSINNRYLYESNTELSIEDYLNTKQFKYPIKYCNFETISPEEQYNICSKAILFISVHGAGCTNCIFTPIECPLIEINFRNHWYCDPVCDDHFTGKININEKCSGTLNYHNIFHKADYHNLCYLIDKKYTEIEAVRYGGKFLSINPISKESIYIDGNNLVKIIEDYIN